MKNVFLLPCFLLLTALGLLHPEKTQAQGWLKFITPPSAFGETVELLQHPGGGVVVLYTVSSTSQVFLAHYNINGVLVWETMVMSPAYAKDMAIGTNSLPSLLINNLTTYRMELHHFDWQGNSLGSTVLDEYQSGNAKPQLVAFPGGGFLSDLNYRLNPPNPPTRVALHRFDAADNLLWRTDIDTLFNPPAMENLGIGVNAQGQSLVGTRFGFGANVKNYLVAFDAQGDTLWQRKDLKPITVGALSDGNFFYVQQNSTSDIVLRKITPDGNLVWQTPCDLYTVFLTRTKYIARADGGLVLCGIGSGPLGKTILIQEFDAQGNQTKYISRGVPGYGTQDLYVYALAPAPGGGYYVTGYVADANVARPYIVKMDADGGIYPQRIFGDIAHDIDLSCSVDAGEPGQQWHKIRIENMVVGNVFYAISDTAGLYVAEADSTQFTVSILPSNPYWESCQGDTLLDFSSGADSIQVDFPLQAVVECPFLEVDVSTNILRRCFNSTYHVRYCNTGTATAEDAYVDVLLDPYMTLDTSSIPGADLGNQQWRFQLGDVPYGDCGDFTMTIYLDCDSTVTGQTHCVEAHIYPDSFCMTDPAWSGANVNVQGICNPDSVNLVIKNIGTGNNSGMLDYVIIEDNIIFRQGTFQLAAGEFISIKVPSNGSTWRLEAEQEPFSPGDPMPSATVEACGVNGDGNFSIGFSTQFGENDGNPYVSVECRESRASFDPNDKQGFPKGVGDEHWVEPGTEIEYLIRFQNTGTDTAFTVVIADTLSAWLDPESVRVGASSHPYSFRMYGTGALEFSFDNILLPDSNVNVEASQGFVKFFARVRPDVPQGTLLFNSAAIYFDFNPPVITNTTFHTIGKNFLTSGIQNVDETQADLDISPNPATDKIRVRFGQATVLKGRLEMIDSQGRTVVRQTFSSDQTWFNTQYLAPGLYLIRAFDGEKWLGSGKVVIGH